MIETYKFTNGTTPGVVGYKTPGAAAASNKAAVAGAGATCASGEATPSATGSGSAAYTSTFKRTEKKYCLSATQYAQIMMVISQHMQPDEYTHTVVNSLYLDTPDSQIIRRSLEKPLYKEKLRVRSYGAGVQGTQSEGSAAQGGASATQGASSAAQSEDNATQNENASAQSYAPATQNQVFIELKKKFDGIVYKRRLAFSTQDAKAFLQGATLENPRAFLESANTRGAHARANQERSTAHARHAAQPTQLTHALTSQEFQVAREIYAFMARYENLEPSMITRCVRDAYSDPDSNLRITFDAQLIAGRPAHGSDPLAFEICAPAMRLLPADQVVMEIKQAGGLPLWLSAALAKYKIYPQTFSKYGKAYEKELKNA